MVSKASAPGKMILFGEHFVVYGTPAIATAISKKIYVVVNIIPENKIEIHVPEEDRVDVLSFEEIMNNTNSDREIVKGCVREIWKHHEPTGLSIKFWTDFPWGSGLGSSAALGVALLRALVKEYNIDSKDFDLQKHAHEVEKILHGNPSGVDTTISNYGGLIFFEKPDKMVPIKMKTNFNIIIGYTGKHGSTKKTVASVRQLMDNYPHRIQPIIDQNKEIVLEAEKILIESEKTITEADFKKLGFLMNLNHGFLNSIGVSCIELENLIFAARNAGAVGAKITGGGDGGCMIALVREKDIEKIADAITFAGGTPIISTIGSLNNNN